MLDAFDADVGSPGTFTGAAMYQTFEDLEYLGPNQYTDLTTRGNGGTAAQTWKIWPLPQGTNDGSDSWQLSSLFSSSLGLTTYATESYNQPGNNIGVFPYTEFLVDFNSSTSDPWRWSSRRAFMNAAVMDQTTHKGKLPKTDAAKPRLFSGVKFFSIFLICHRHRPKTARRTAKQHRDASAHPGYNGGWG